ncbi:MAG: hypothetical protein M0Q13_02615 [Methanothrix sp.]|jgi:hypothetical protein|nr:hypothetical protein [Methanothrix sp.]
MKKELAGFINGYVATESYGNSNNFSLVIEKITVFLTNTTDKIHIITNLPSPFPIELDNSNLTLEFQVSSDKGL